MRGGDPDTLSEFRDTTLLTLKTTAARLRPGKDDPVAERPVTYGSRGNLRVSGCHPTRGGRDVRPVSPDLYRASPGPSLRNGPTPSSHRQRTPCSPEPTGSDRGQQSTTVSHLLDPQAPLSTGAQGTDGTLDDYCWGGSPPCRRNVNRRTSPLPDIRRPTLTSLVGPGETSGVDPGDWVRSRRSGYRVSTGSRNGVRTAVAEDSPATCPWAAREMVVLRVPRTVTASPTPKESSCRQETPFATTENLRLRGPCPTSTPTVRPGSSVSATQGGFGRTRAATYSPWVSTRVFRPDPNPVPSSPMALRGLSKDSLSPEVSPSTESLGHRPHRRPWLQKIPLLPLSRSVPLEPPYFRSRAPGPNKDVDVAVRGSERHPSPEAVVLRSDLPSVTKR